VSIVCTQPRRISAIGVAQRVADERCERLGATVGYSIRMEAVTSAATRLLFCTTGILLRRLEDDPGLNGTTHVVVDEVHERSMESDFLLMTLRDLAARRRDLRVVLMSATIEAHLFSNYFGGCPTISIPGRTFPVTALYLEDALEVTAHRVRPGADRARKGGSRSGPPRGGERGGFGGGGYGGGYGEPPPPPPPPPRRALGSGGSSAALAGRQLGGEPGSLAASDAPDEELGAEELAERYPRYGAGALRALAASDPGQINFELVGELVAWILRCGGVPAAQAALGSALGLADDAWDSPGAAPAAAAGRRGGASFAGGADLADSILVFLPGVKEIQATYEQLTGSGPLSFEPQRSWVLPLHGMLSSEEQRGIFARPPPGVRKIVLATNIAETSITIDDCGFVIDCGRMRETRYDPARRMESLEDVPVSRANAQQRRGRAGRVKSGICFHLFTRHAFERRLEAQQAPEMQRVPLEQLVLRIKVLRYPGTAASVVARCLQPPAAEAVERAVQELVRLEALTLSPSPTRGAPPAEALTALGMHLASLPVDVRIGKLILLGSIFGVVDDVLTIAAVLSYRAPFLSPFERRDEADASKRSFCVAQSDHLTALNAYRAFDRGGANRFDMCRERFLGVKTMMQIAQVKRQLLELLSAARFVRPGLRARSVESLGRRADGSDGVRLALAEGAPGSVRPPRRASPRSPHSPPLAGRGLL